MIDNNKIIGNLIGIRGIAAIWVLGYHYHEYFVNLFPNLRPYLIIFTHGYFGVDLFFSLSGYILGYKYFNEFSSSKLNTKALRNYWVARFARIYPLYLITTLGSLLMFQIGKFLGHDFNHESPDALSNIAIVSNIFAVQTWFNLPSLNGPAWSVSAEFAVYLIFPFIVLLNYRLNRFQLFYNWALFFCVYTFYSYSLQNKLFLPQRITQVFTEFIMGWCTFIISMHFRVNQVNIKLIRRIVTLFVLLLILSSIETHLLNLIIPIFLVSLVALNGFQNQNNIGLSRRAFVVLGKWSYALYLSHRMIQHLMSGLNLPNYESSVIVRLIQIVILCFLPILIAGFLTVFVENPCRKVILRNLSSS